MTTKAYQDFLEKCSNAYLDFIQDCREKAKDYSSEQLGQCQTHHIVPRHHYKNHKLSPETFNLPQNLVELTFEDHVKAHQLRFEVYGEYADQVAVKSMKGLKEEPTALQRVSQLIKGEKKSLYGWSCEKIKRDEGLN